MENENLKALSLCDGCYQAADQGQAATSDSCDVCQHRSTLAELRSLLSVKDGRIEDLEAQVDKLKQQLKDSESQLLNGIGIVDTGRTATENGGGTGNSKQQNGKNKNGAKTVAAAKVEEPPPPDSRPHVMLIGDNLFGKLRKAPHFIYEHLGRIPRLISRTKPDAGVLEMTRNAKESLSADKVTGRNFHVLWFGGLHDTTLEDYARKSYLEKLVECLSELRSHERVLSVSWCTLPETAHNAEAREINEHITTWISELDQKPDENVPIKLVDLRYISRRDGTMEVNEAMWTSKGSKLVSESLKKALNERLEFTQKELEGIESSSKAMLEARERKEKNKTERKAKHEANLQEQQLRRQQKLAKQVLLKAGHPIPGSGASTSNAAVKNGGGGGGGAGGGSGGGNNARGPKTPNKPNKAAPKTFPRNRRGRPGPSAPPQRKPAFPEAFAAPKRPYQGGFPVDSEGFSPRKHRSDPYFDTWETKRSRPSNEDESPYPFAPSSDSFFRREDTYRRSSNAAGNLSGSSDNNRYHGSSDRNMYNLPDEQVRRMQWEAYDRLRP